MSRRADASGGAGLPQLPLALRLQAAARFGTFVPGSNVTLVAHLRAAGAGARCEPLWLWGPAGAGKTHLLQAATALAAERGGRAMYLTAEQLEHAGVALLGGLEAVELLALDDVDRLAGRPEWEQALFMLSNAFHDTPRCLLMAAQSVPRSAGFVLADLASRAAASTVYRLAPLDEAQRLEALRRHAEHRGIDLDEAAARYLLLRVDRDMASICRWLQHLDEASLAAQRKVTVPFIREALAARAL